MDLARELIREVVEHRMTLSEAQANELLCEILGGTGFTDPDLAALLTTMAERGETAAELTGFVRAMRARMTPLPLTAAERAQLIDTCGTGGDGCGTFNISTAAALVAAAAGAKVAKHGNRALTSKCGSADVLEALGVPVDLSPGEAAQCLRETSFVFLYAPSAHPAMRRVQHVRRALPFRTIFNLAGPLTNPAGAPAQVVGVFAEDRIALVAESLAALGTRHSLVVHGSDGLDELTITGPSRVAEVRGAVTDGAAAVRNPVRHSTIMPEHVGLPRAPKDALRGGDTAAENAAILDSILHGAHGPRRDIVLFNTAAALVATEMARDLESGIRQSAEAIDSGRARGKLAELRAFGEARKTGAHAVVEQESL